MSCSFQIFAVNKHELPIGQMGNYQEHLKKISPLREVDSGLVRTQLFGNPFKLEKTDKVQLHLISNGVGNICCFVLL